MASERKSFFLLIFVLIAFTIGAFLFSENDYMVYDETEEKEKDKSVSASVAEINFFTDFRIHRDRRRDEAKELYCSVLLDENRSEEKRAEAEESLEKLYRVSSMEDRVEDILIGRNYHDVIFVLEDNMSLLIIGQKSLDEEEKENLISFVSTYAGIDAGSLSVFTIDS